MVAKTMLAIVAGLLFLIPALLALADGLTQGQWSANLPLFAGLTLLAFAEAAGADDHESREEVDQREQTATRQLLRATKPHEP